MNYLDSTHWCFINFTNYYIIKYYVVKLHYILIIEISERNFNIEILALTVHQIHGSSFI